MSRQLNSMIKSKNYWRKSKIQSSKFKHYKKKNRKKLIRVRKPEFSMKKK